MEFSEKLQELRKSKGLTQEELAEALYVSRTAISKWESGRGYPSIDSLREISQYFSVSIDDLLSGEKLLSLAERENKSNIRSMCDLLLGIVDLFSLMLIILPLYPHSADGHVYSVNLLEYGQARSGVYWFLFAGLMMLGATKLLLTKYRPGGSVKIVTDISFVLHILTVVFLALTREAYGVTIAFLLLVVKAILLIKQTRAG